MEIHTQENGPGGIGFYIEETPKQGTAVQFQTHARTEIGPLRLEVEKEFQPDDVIESTGITPGKKCTFRLLIRQYLMELYLNDLLVQCYVVYEVNPSSVCPYNPRDALASSLNRDALCLKISEHGK